MLKVDVSGLSGFQKKLAIAQNRVIRLVDAELKAAAMDFEQMAKAAATDNGGDRGTLARSIRHNKVSELKYNVTAATYYAPFIEFGTKSKAKIPADLQDVAAQFKGQKGTGALSLIEAIRAWVKRKKIGATYNIKTRRKNRQSANELDTIAFLIARSIYKNGISPRPFFYKNVAPVRQKLTERLNQVLSGI